MLTLALKFVFVWIVINLLHEVFHIKHNGFLRTGDIQVGELGFTCIADKWSDSDLYGLSGGVFSAIVCFILFFITSDIEFGFCFFLTGWVELVYGIFEWSCDYTGWDINYRFGIYLAVGTVCILYWWWLI